MIFRELFYENFIKRFNKISEKLLEKIINSKFYKLENTALSCLLGNEILEIEKTFSFHFFQMFRYYFLVDPKFK